MTHIEKLQKTVLTKRYLIILLLFVATSSLLAQPSISVKPNLGISATTSTHNFEELGAGHLFLGCKFSLPKYDFFFLELRGKYTLCKYKDEDWMYGGDKFGLSFQLPSVCVVPGFQLKVNEKMTLLLENEFSFGWISGSVNYPTVEKKTKIRAENIFSYTPSVGLGYEFDKVQLIGMIGYSSLDLNDIVNRNRPNSNLSFPNLKLDLTFSVMFNFLF